MIKKIVYKVPKNGLSVNIIAKLTDHKIEAICQLKKRRFSIIKRKGLALSFQ
jgi:hypothetical protein